MHIACRLCLIAACSALFAPAGELPAFVTYSHHTEEPGNLEVALNNVAGAPKGGNAFLGSLLELEYGLKTWWTTELYLSGQSTRNESALFTGYRIENRFRPLMGEHRINPVIYVEFADVNGADKSFREVVGHDSFAGELEPNAGTRLERKREIETRLILSSDVKGWNISENFIAEKNLSNEAWEFGYSFGINRPLRMAATPDPCRFCRENFRAGVEMFGGLGDWHRFALRDTSHYVAPAIAWDIPGGPTLAFSPAFGVNGNSHGVLWRFTAAYEIEQVSRLFRKGADR